MHAAPIRNLQIMLRVLQENAPIPSGIYGQETEAAVRSFQLANGLPPTGRTDYATWNAVVCAYLARRKTVLESEHTAAAMHRTVCEAFSNLCPFQQRHDAVSQLQGICGLAQTGQLGCEETEHLRRLYRLVCNEPML